MLYENNSSKIEKFKLIKEENRKDNQIEELNSQGCYITTVMCDILGYSDHCFVLNEMRNLRNNVMKKDEKYFDILSECDIIGPVIAKYIREEYDYT